jgi:DNA invertase Pin-like site-specific DNA recombinase
MWCQYAVPHEGLKLMAKTVFYLRVSTRDQKPDLQIDAAKRLGVKTANIFVEKASGARHDRPVLAKALAALEKGDTLACYKLDRVGRSLHHLSGLLKELEDRGIHFRTADGSVNTSGPTGKLLLHVLGAVAQFERDLILERTRAGLAAARARGRSGGRPPKMSLAKIARARHLMAAGELNADEVAGTLKVSRRTLFRALATARAHDEAASDTQTYGVAAKNR